MNPEGLGLLFKPGLVLSALLAAMTSGAASPGERLNAALVVSPAVEESVFAHPDSNGFWTGRVKSDGTKYTKNLAIITNPDFRGWARFNLAAIPDSAIITEVRLRYHFYSSQGDASACWRHLSKDPLTEPGPSLYNLCGTDTIVSDSAVEPFSGFQTRNLNPVGVAAVQSGLAQDWVAFAWHRAGPVGWRYCYGYENGELKPRLTVVYQPVAGAQEPAPSVARPEFTLCPNPARNGFAACLWSGPGPASLSVFDISGRSVFSVRLARSTRTGSSPMPLRLVPGVYLVRLESPARSATEKLVVQQ